MKHYYAEAVDLDQRGDTEGLHALAVEWLAGNHKYRVFGVLDRAVAAARE